MNSSTPNPFDTNQRLEDENSEILIPCLSNLSGFTFDELRKIIWEDYGLERDSRIFYIDDDGDKVLIDSECEFLEALKFAKSSMNKRIPMFVEHGNRKKQYFDINNVPDKEHLKNTDNIATNLMSRSSVATKDKTLETTSKPDEYLICKMMPQLNRKDSDRKRCVDPDKEQDDTDNATGTTSTCSNTTTSTVMKQMADKVSEALLDNELHQPKASVRCYSDTSPPPWFTEYMELMKKDMVSAITEEVVKNVTEMLNKRMDCIASLQSTEYDQSRSQIKRHTRCPSDSHSKEKKHKRKSIQEQISDILLEYENQVSRTQRNTYIAKDYQRTLQELERLEKMLRLNPEKKKHSNCKAMNNLDRKDTGKEQQEQPVQNIMRENLPSHAGQNLYDEKQSETPKVLDNELRMNCSITGHQMLDKGRRKDMCCSISDIDSISIISDNSNATTIDQEEDTFEIIEMASVENAARSEGLTATGQHDSSRDSPSFELLSETLSPSLSIYINEDHFRVNENHFCVNDENIDTPGEINNESHNVSCIMDPNKPLNIECDKHSDKIISSFIAETLPLQEAFLTSAYIENQSHEQKNSHDDVKSSHTSYPIDQTDQIRYSEDPPSYPKTHSQRSCQSQTDSGDFTQSFHSHTTSITDNGDAYAEVYSRFTEQMLLDAAKDSPGASTTSRNEPDCNRSRVKRPEECSHFHQPTRRGTSGRYSNGPRKSRPTQQVIDTVDPIHILPLVTAAAHMGSFAYDTAREVLSKIRMHKGRCG